MPGRSGGMEYIMFHGHGNCCWLIIIILLVLCCCGGEFGGGGCCDRGCC